ncbi:MAG: phosphodiester glycosidase family protein [Candidatus Marinimicrobia bacterium]|nr:phosphodiester glycosidase family protein [Candidatus Neomarinimicrobiota bacterium]
MLAKYKFLVVCFFLLLSYNACVKVDPDSDLKISWHPIDSLNADLPESIRVFEGVNEEIPLTAWYVKINMKDADLKVDVVASDDSSGRETVSSFAEDLGACLVVNGGYFRMDLNPTKHVGLLAIDDEIWHNSTYSVTRDTLKFYIARGAVGIDEAGNVDIAWVSSHNDSLFEWKEPFANQPLKPIVKPDISDATSFDFPDVLSAGPVLVQDGSIYVTSDEEVFFGTSIPKIHPRTAVGYTEKGELLLVVVDGRQLQSRGVGLNELAWIMKSLGAVEALNLDGGGSSSMVVNGVLLNKPAGSSVQRPVMSAIAVICN